MSKNFEYFTPTKVVFGKDKENDVGSLIKALNYKKVLIHYGGNHIIKSGLLDRIKKSLSQEGIQFIELSGVVPNPRLSLVYKGIELCKKENVDFILAIGGGSVIDSSKAIGYGVTNEGDVWEFYDQKRNATNCLPIGVVLTIAAAGSEMSKSSVITKDEGGIKRGYSNDLCRPKFAILNPELTMSLSDYQTASGCVDTLMHTMERYFTPAGNLELTDKIAESLMISTIKHALILKENPQNYESRAEIMWAGSLSHNGLTSCGGDNGDWSTHKLEHELSGMFDVTHGSGLAALWPSWARYVYKSCLDRFYKFAINVMNIENIGTKEEIALKGIQAMESFYHQINMPTNLKELGLNITEDDIHELATKCSIAVNGSVGTAKLLNKNDFINIYKLANEC